MRKLTFVLPILAALFIACAPANATLIGTTVTGTLTTNQQPVPTVPFISPALVGAGIEFSGTFTDVFNQIWDITVDLGASSLAVGIKERTGLQGGNVSSLGLLRLTFSGSDELGLLALQNYSCASAPLFPCNAFGLGPSLAEFSFAANILTIGFDTIRTGETYLFAAPQANVPVPATLALFGIGSLGMFFARRRKISTAV